MLKPLRLDLYIYGDLCRETVIYRFMTWVLNNIYVKWFVYGKEIVKTQR